LLSAAAEAMELRGMALSLRQAQIEADVTTGKLTAASYLSQLRIAIQVSLYKILFHLQEIGSLQSFIDGVNHPVIVPPHLQSPSYCNTIAQPLRNTPPPPHRVSPLDG